MKKVYVIFFSLTLVFVFSCKSSNFQGGGEAQYLDVLKTENITCSKDQLNVYKTVSKSGSHKTKMAVTGQICLGGKVTKVTGQANVVFIVDTSNSMEYADPSNGLTCERKKAINTVKDALTGGVSSSNVKGAVVTFGQTASSSGWANLKKISTWGVCSHNGGTNYEAAFKKAESLLSGKSGVNIIYFITDGAPSVRSNSSSYGNYWEEGEAGGREGMSSLKSSVSNLVVNAIYLKDPNLSTYGSDAPTADDTYDYLVDIVGSSSRVRQASSASELTSQITSFDTTPAGTFKEKEDVTATVTVGSSSKKVDIKSLEHIGEGKYQYELDEVYLEGKSGKVVDNIFKVVGHGSDGSTATSTITVQFSQTT